MQLAFFPHNTKVEFDPAAAALIVLACSGKKAAVRSPALHLYQGVMYQTYRAHTPCGTAAPAMVILSAKHGFVAPDDTLDPYDLQMTTARADEILKRLNQSVMQVAWPFRASRVLLAGGQTYRRVMRAAIRLVGAGRLPIEEVSGGIGNQRSQLARFLAGMAPQFVEQIGSHPNGNPVFRRYGPFEVGAEVELQYRVIPGSTTTPAHVLALFPGPIGPTAEVEIACDVKGRMRGSTRWVSVTDLGLTS
ncbi:DUF6884 domain-containing protein [Cupriavidus metallidurans]|uniref:DUF6884 domain-containing protein n=1 Tax=Cupriavidus metallidurans TaxID=119219 RepID=UPI0004932B70|nr:DUF6884 domain-containing protein [Cupriavidus metallidurans]